MADRRSSGDNLWRDLAATVVSEISESLRNSRGQSGPPRARDASDPAGDSPGVHRPHSGQYHYRARGGSGIGAVVSAEIKKAVVTGLQATTDSINRSSAEREQRKARAPIRRARAKATQRYVGAGFLGFMALGGVARAANLAAEYEGAQQAAAIAPAVMAVGFGAGGVAVARQGRRYSARADRLEQEFDAASISTSRLTGSPTAQSMPLPPASSAAYEPLKALYRQKSTLAELLPEVADVAPDLAPLAAESERALFDVAERITLLERAAGSGVDSTGIGVPLGRATDQLTDGVAAHQKLVDAAATVVAELSTTQVTDSPSDSMSNAADRLDALAMGLRQVRSDVVLDHEVTFEHHEPVVPPQPTGPAPRPSNRARRADRDRGTAS